jgi:hypothetical protein
MGVAIGLTCLLAHAVEQIAKTTTASEPRSDEQKKNIAMDCTSGANPQFDIKHCPFV